MSGIQPGDMRAANVQWTKTCPDCGQEIEERTLDQGNVWVHIKTSPKGNQEISEKCFAPDPERVAQVGEMVLLAVTENVDPWSLRMLPAVVTKSFPGNPLLVELTVFADDGPRSKVSAGRLTDRDREALIGSEGMLGKWKFLD